MKKISCLTFALATGIIASLTTGIEAANAETARTFLIPFTGVVHDTCYTQTTASSSGTSNKSMCDTYQASSSNTETVQVSQNNTEANSSAQDSSADRTSGQMTTVVR